MIGRMNERVAIQTQTTTTNAEGFGTEAYATVAELWASVEHRSGSRAWANRAAWTTATELFVFRAPAFDLTGRHVLLWGADRYVIDDVKPVAGSDYLEVLAEVVTDG